MNKYFYRIDFEDRVYLYEDESKYDPFDDIDREGLFTLIGLDSYHFNPDIWNEQTSHEIVLCEENGMPIRGMIVEMYWKPAFDVFEKYPHD